MARWDESWLHDYQLRRAAVSARLPDMIRFDIPYLLPTLNDLLRMHWSGRRKSIQGLSETVAALTVDLPKGAPIERARVEVVRHCIVEPDPDNLNASVKHLLDVLQPRSDRHPWGLGIVAGDDPAHLELAVSAKPVRKRAEQRTAVIIERRQ